ncbi:hypothetical protein [Halobacillus amylolyticus]|uniref:Uncharacterized protein n=1 Tax=Halobacillus amylolyticus TaxID=2932259 RepID=A0ABY4HGF0_9BACI|nr:hypothetical protein [Halobacillus amylolyticus]UOR13452.1 hypothetical protein MUO15_08360 [Halobacillus amylolyticus]
MSELKGFKKFYFIFNLFILAVAMGVIVVYTMNDFETSNGVFYMLIGLIIACGSIVRLYKLVKS